MRLGLLAASVEGRGRLFLSEIVARPASGVPIFEGSGTESDPGDMLPVKDCLPGQGVLLSDPFQDLRELLAVPVRFEHGG